MTRVTTAITITILLSLHRYVTRPGGGGLGGGKGVGGGGGVDGVVGSTCNTKLIGQFVNRVTMLQLRPLTVLLLLLLPRALPLLLSLLPYLILYDSPPGGFGPPLPPKGAPPVGHRWEVLGMGREREMLRVLREVTSMLSGGLGAMCMDVRPAKRGGLEGGILAVDAAPKPNARKEVELLLDPILFGCRWRTGRSL